VLFFVLLDIGEHGAQPNTGLNVTQTFYVVTQGHAGCVYAIFLLLLEDCVSHEFVESFDYIS